MLVPPSLIESILPEELKKSFDQIDKDSILKIIETLNENLETCKNDINELAKSNIKDLKPEINKSENFISKITNLLNQINRIKFDLESQENLVKNASEIDEYKKLIDHIEVINKIILAIKSFKTFESNLNNFKASIEKKNYSNCREYISKLIEINENCEFFSKKYESENEILIVKELKEDFIVQRERLWYELDIEWDNMIIIDTIHEQHQKISISKKVDQEFLNELTQFSKFKESYSSQTNTSNETKILNISFVFQTRLKQFCKKFLELCQNFILNAIDDDNQLVYECELIDDEKKHRAELKFKKSDFKGKNEKLLDFKLRQLTIMLKFLYENLFQYKVFVIHQTNENKNRQVKLISIFSDLLLKDFVKLIYEKLIIGIIPLKNYDINLEASICDQVAQFESELKKIEFINQIGSENVFKVFVNNVEELYVRKKCKNIMESAREMMKNKDYLFEVIEIEEKNISLQKIRISLKSFRSNEKYIDLFNKLATIDEQKIKDENKTKLDELNLLILSPCSISKIAQRLIEMIYETLNEALKMTENSKNVRNISLSCLIARNLFDLYISVVPLYHAEGLHNLPILSAIVYNDLKYLSYNCLTLTHQYKELFLNLEQKSSSSSIDMNDLMEIISNFSCLDLIPKLFSTGRDILFKQIQIQQNNLIQFLNEDTNGISNISESNNFDLFKKALQKCIFQINNLSSIWLKILTQEDYYAILGQFFQIICNNLLKSVLKLEDISSDDASYLHSAFGLINQCVYDLMSRNKNDNQVNTINQEDSNEQEEQSMIDLVVLSNRNKIADLEASKYIKSWQRFKHLLILLKANLAEIVDLWSDKMGPLALHYNSEEIRHLIRALFMNTDRRADALARIK